MKQRKHFTAPSPLRKKGKDGGGWRNDPEGKKRSKTPPRYMAKGGTHFWSPVFGNKNDPKYKPDPSKRVYGDPPGSTGTARPWDKPY